MFCKNFILSIYSQQTLKFFLDDVVIIVTSSVNRLQPICVLFSPTSNRS